VPALSQHRTHSRNFQANKFVYPVLSRRSRGISIGVNLNPDKVCNFDCIYCQVNRRAESETRLVEIVPLLAELDDMLGLVTSGELYGQEPFAAVPVMLRRLNDIAFSGDGEPTTCRNIDQIVALVAELRRRHGLDQTKMVLITNGSMFHRPIVKKALGILDRNNGEIWAKLEAGTDAYFQIVNRTKIPFQRVLDNILDAARLRPLVIQSLFMNVAAKPPPVDEIQAFIHRLKAILAAGGRVKRVQVYTVARQPAQCDVTPLSNVQVDAIAHQVQEQTGVAAEAFYGAE